MFKRDNEQPVKNSFEENKEKRKKRSLRERLSIIPVRRRVEAVILAVVTIMASLSIDWSSLSARAEEGETTMQSKQSISMIFRPSQGQETTTLTEAKISVKIPSAAKAVTVNWKVYQNLEDETDPESGASVGNGGSGTISYKDGDFVEYKADLTSSKVVLLGNETAAVVFTLQSKDGYDITYKTYNTTDTRYVKENGHWNAHETGGCINYESSAGGDPVPVELLGVPEKLALTAGETYDFSEKNSIELASKYKRTLTLTRSETDLIDADIEYPIFKITDDVNKSGPATVTIGGTGIAPKSVDVKVVSFAVNEKNGKAKDGKWVFTYTGKEFTAADLYTAKCGDASLEVAEYFTTSFSKNPKSAGDYTMTIEGQEGTDYEGLVYTKDFTIEQKALSNEMIKDATATVKDGVIESISGVKDGGTALRKGVHFDAKIAKATPGTDKVDYEITLTGKGNYTDSVTLDATETAELKFQSVVDHVRFESTEGIYNGKAQETKIVFCDSNDQPVYTDVFEEGKNYYVRYNGRKRGSNVDGVINAESIVDAGEYTATVIGMGKYTGSSITTSNSFVVRPISLTTDNTKVELEQSSFEYSDSLVIRPEIKDVTYTVSNTETRGLAAGTDYVLKNDEYARDIGGHNVTVLGLGNYEGEASAKYNVFASLLNSAKVALDSVIDGEMRAEQTAEWDYVWTHNKAFTYTGNAKKPGFTVKVNDDPVFVGTGDGYMTVSDGVNNTKVSTNGNKAYFILTLPAKYANKKIKVEFEIAAKPLLADALVLDGVEDMPYAYGKEITLENGSDGYYVVDGESILEEDTDYSISYEDNINAGTAKITATGMGNYSGTLTKTFTITPINVKDVTVEIKPQKLNTSGTVVTNMDDVVITVKDKNGKTINHFTEDDFSLENYKNNKAAWLESSDGPQPQVKFVGKRNLTGTKIVYFTIQKESLEGLEWRLDNKPSVKGTLGSPNTTIDLTEVFGYAEDFVPNLGGRTISLYYGNQRFDYYNCTASTGEAGTNTIKISGKKNYDGGDYYFTYEVRRIDISNCEFKQTEKDNNGDGLPEFTLSYNGTTLTKGTDYTEEISAEKNESGEYPAGEDGYSVTFTGLDAYEGTLTKTFHVGTPFDKDHVFVTMYGPAGTGTESGENRLTYFGDNDPYFILTSNETVASSKIDGPAYKNGAYGTGGNYDITFSPSDAVSRHKVGTEVTVTFKAKEGGSTWYNPKNSNGVTYKYTVVPGIAGSDSTYGNLATGLSIYTAAVGGTPNADNKKGFSNSTVGAYGGVIKFSDFKYKYTTEGMDPDIYIYYDPAKVDKTCATQSTTEGTPALELGTEISYFNPVEVKFNDPGLFTVNKDSVSATDPDRTIVMTPVDGGWLASLKLQVTYGFDPASLSDATIAFNPTNAEYTYSGKEVDPNYSVTIGKSTLNLESDYKVEGYGTYSGDELSIDKITTIKNNLNNLNNPSTTDISNALKESGVDSFSTSKPENAGIYVLVIGPGSGNNYKGYNIAKFSIATASFTAELEKSDFSVTYGDTSKTAPVAGDLLVMGVDGTTKLEPQTDETKDGYKIGASTGSDAPKTDAQVEIIGTGNYKGCTRYVQYKVVANISSGQAEGLPDFKNTNLDLTDAHMVNTNCLKLILKNDGGLPFIDGKNTRFDPDKLTLSDGTITIPSSYLKTTIARADNNSGDNITSVGKKMITISAATGAPVKGTREYYYVEVFADISTADVTLEANGATVKDDIVSYTGQNITVSPVVRFRGSILDRNYYTNDNNTDGSYSYMDVGSYKMRLKGNGAYYEGTAEKAFSIAYDLKNGVEIVYEKTEESGTSYVPLAGMSFSYTGSGIGATIRNSIKVRVKGPTATFLKEGQGDDYTLDFANDTNPGGNTASVTINHTATNSINSQTVYFSIGGSDLNETTCSIGLTPNTFVYDGTAKEPAVSVTYDNGSRQLVLDSDYKVTYSNNINVPASSAAEDQKPSVTVTGINGKYVGSITKTFNITAKQLTTSDVDFPDVPFGGSDASGNLLPATPTITVTSDGKTLVEGTDYEISYPTKQADESVDQYFTKAKDTIYTIKVTGKGNYSGEVTKTAKQLSGTLNSPNIIIDPSQPMTSVYNGRKVTFGSTGPVIRNGNSTLRYGVDYSIEIPEIINAGSYDIKITALSGGYYYDNGSSKTFSYTVTPRPIEGNEGAFVTTLYDPKTGNVVSDGAGFAFTGEKIEPLVRLVDNGVTPDTSVVNNIWTNNTSLSVNPMMNGFTASYGDNKLAGEKSGSVTLTASGNYTGTITKYFNIGTDINNVTLSYDKTSADYDGTPKSQNITVSYNGQTLEAGTAYESPIVYTWKGGSTPTPTEVGEYTPVIKGRTDGGFYGEKQGSTFRIIAKNKSQDIEIRFNGRDGEVEAGDYVCHYNGKQQKPSITVYDTSVTPNAAIPSENYTVTYGNNINVGSGYVYVTLKGNYTGSAQEVFFIEPCDISKMTFAFAEGENGVIKNIPESSFPYVPLFKLTGLDDNGEEFELSYADSRLKQYLVIPDESKAKKPGKGSLKVIGTGNLEGTTNPFDYEIYGRLSESNVSVKAPVYTGTKKDPEVTVTFAGQTLVKDEDYSLRVVSSDQTGQAGGDVIVKGLGYFGGNVYVKYGESGDVSSLVLRGYSQQYVYSGRFAGPEESAIYAADSEGNQVIPADKLECTFTSSVDKEACVSANATVTITSKATLDDGTVVAGPSATYKIVQRNISSCDIKQLSSDNYTGKGLTPPISVSYDRKTYSGTVVTGHDVIALVSGRDYGLSYRNNVNPGTAEVTVTGKGNYTGTKRFMFTIKVVDMGAVTARQTGGSTVVTWTARPHVTGYRVLYNTNGMEKIETKGTTMTLSTVPSVVGVQAYVKDSSGNVTYGIPKYVAVTR